MKKLSLHSATIIAIIILTLSFSNSYSQSGKGTKPPCANLSKPLDGTKINDYVDNYYSIVTANSKNAVDQINFIKPELVCLSALTSNPIKFIFASPDKDPNNVFVVVEIKNKSGYTFYNLDDMFPRPLTEGNKTSGHICPPPTPCPIPLLNQ